MGVRGRRCRRDAVTRARPCRQDLVPIRTGELEEHIVADVAWAAGCYVDWTGDEAFAAGPGRELFVRDRALLGVADRVDADGRGHIHGVIGPDEYHEPVDDNAFTNVMARWNLRRAAELRPGRRRTGRESREWLALADALVDGYDPETRLYEQFAGFFALGAADHRRRSRRAGRSPPTCCSGRERVPARRSSSRPTC